MNFNDKKRVIVRPVTKPLFNFNPPIDKQCERELTVSQIYDCMYYGAEVFEILNNGIKLRLTFTNYSKDNNKDIPIINTVVSNINESKKNNTYNDTKNKSNFINTNISDLKENESVDNNENKDTKFEENKYVNSYNIKKEKKNKYKQNKSVNNYNITNSINTNTSDLKENESVDDNENKKDDSI